MSQSKETFLICKRFPPPLFFFGLTGQMCITRRQPPPLICTILKSCIYLLSCVLHLAGRPLTALLLDLEKEGRDK